MENNHFEITEHAFGGCPVGLHWSVHELGELVHCEGNIRTYE